MKKIKSKINSLFHKPASSKQYSTDSKRIDAQSQRYATVQHNHRLSTRLAPTYLTGKHKQMASEHPMSHSMSQYDISFYPHKHPAEIAGAKGDGIADDTRAVQNALNSTPVGGEFYLPHGTYSITTTLRINQRITIRGPGVLQCDIKYAVPDWSNWMLVITADGCHIDGINFINKSGREGVSVMLVEGSNFTLTNCIMESFYQGIMLGRLVDQSTPFAFYSNIQITNNKILSVYGVTGGSIAHGDGIAFFGCTDVNIANNVITAANGRTPRNGINSGPEGYIKSTRVMIANNTVTGDWDYAITTEGGTHCQILHNYVDGCCINGILERGENILVSENRINILPGRDDRAGLLAGIQFYGVDNSTISKNVITGVCKYGIICKPSHEAGGGHNTLVKENILDGDFHFGLYFGNTTQTTVCNNTIKNRSEDRGCMGIHGWYNSDLVCERNEIEAPNGTAFILQGTTNAEIKNNKTVNTRVGVHVGRETTRACICDNDFTDCADGKFSQSEESQDITEYNNNGSS